MHTALSQVPILFWADVLSVWNAHIFPFVWIGFVQVLSFLPTIGKK